MVVDVNYLKKKKHMCQEKCPKCHFVGLKNSLERHFKQKHTIEINPFCAEVFKGGIDRHITNTNCGNDPIKEIPKAACPQCKKILKSKEMLKVHVKQCTTKSGTSSVISVATTHTMLET